VREGESGEDEEGEEGGEDEYIDPREIASAFIFPRLSRRVSQRVLRRMDTMMNTDTVATPTYLRIIGPDEEKEEGSRALRRRELDRSALSCCTTEDDLSSVDWDAGDEAPTSPTQNHTHLASELSPAPADHTHRVNRVRRRRSNRMTAAVQQDSDDERIYERIDDLALPTCDIGAETGGPKFQVPRKLTLPRRRSKVTANRRQQLSSMKGFDGYEYLVDTSPTPVEGVRTIPRWTEMSPALPPPRNTSAPVKNGAVEHVPIHPALSVPLEPSHGPQSRSPAISSDDTNQSDCEAIPELLYTTPCFVTMESTPGPLESEGGHRRSQSLHKATTVQATYTTISPGKEVGEAQGKGGGGGDGRSHLPLAAKKSHTLPTSSSSSKGVDHCGYLTKLDSRLRPGKRRWFVLVGQELRYYRSKEASLGRPRKVISLNSWCKLAVVNDVIFKLMTSLQTFHLSGGSAQESEEWVQALRSALRRPSGTPPHHVHHPSSPSLSGWAFMQSEKRATRKMWCHLDSTGILSISPAAQAEVGVVMYSGCGLK
jgi:hypothetical protein